MGCSTAIRSRAGAAFAALVAFAGCAAATSPVPPAARLGPFGSSGSSPIQHVIMIVQENRSFDNLFAKFPGANGATRGEAKIKDSSGYRDKWIVLKARPLVCCGPRKTEYDLQHCHAAFETAYDGGKMDGFYDEGKGACVPGHTPAPAATAAYQYVKESDIAPYWDIAKQWVLADAMFQTQGSGSFTAHQDLIRGGTCFTSKTSCNINDPSSGAESLIDDPGDFPWGCDAPGGHTPYINIYGDEYSKGPFPCSNDFDDYGSGGYATLRDLLDAAGVSWKYYTPCFSTNNKIQKGCDPSYSCPEYNCAGGTLDAFDVIYPVRYGSEWGTNVSWPDTNIFSDIDDGALPAVSWVIPEDTESDHPDEKGDTGPEWVASLVNAIGQSNYWGSSAVIVLWDDWGGFYDNAAPPFQDGFGGLGMRVPMMVISPYAIAGHSTKGGYISHTQYEFGSVLAYVENNWNLGNLGTTDARATPITNVFDYSQKPRSFSAIPSKLSAQYFIHQPHEPQHGDPQ
jgi:phospholipase C